jgi:hypothetical protein
VVITQGVFILRSSKSDDHITGHGNVLIRVVSRLIQISVFPSTGVTSSLNNQNDSERERVNLMESIPFSGTLGSGRNFKKTLLLLIDKTRVKTYI